jgi:hypothetical protein
MTEVSLTPPDTRDPNELLRYIGELQHAHLALRERTLHMDATDAQLGARWQAETDRRVREIHDGTRAQIQAIDKQYAELLAKFMSNAQRYQMLRPHRVRCTALGILASEAYLDYLLDKLIEARAAAQRNASLLMPGPPPPASGKET